MSLLNFPTNPNPGDLYTLGTTTFQWTGYAWIKYTGSGVASTLTVSNVISVTSGTNSTGTSTGGIVVNGGVGVSQDMYVGGHLYVLNTDNSTSTTTGAVVVSGGVAVDGNLMVFSATNSTSTTTGAIVVSGGIGVSGDIYVQGRVNSESLRIAESVFDSTQTSVNTTATTIIDSYSVSQYRGAKYLIQVDEGTGPGASFSFEEMLLLVDNDNVVSILSYGELKTDGVLGSFAAGVVDGNLELYFIPASPTSKVINVLRTAMIK